MVVIEVASISYFQIYSSSSSPKHVRGEGECKNRESMVMLWRCHFNGRENGHVTEVVSLIEGELSYYGGGQFKGERIVIVRRWPA